jgi:hypothetical protein
MGSTICCDVVNICLADFVRSSRYLARPCLNLSPFSLIVADCETASLICVVLHGKLLAFALLVFYLRSIKSFSCFLLRFNHTRSARGAFVPACSHACTCSLRFALQILWCYQAVKIHYVVASNVFRGQGTRDTD